MLSSFVIKGDIILSRVVIFTDDPGWHGKQLVQAFAHHQLDSIFVSLTACKIQIHNAEFPLFIPGFHDELPCAAFVRGVPGGSLEEVVFYLDVLHILKALNVPVYNDGRAIEASVDKGMTSFLLQQNEIPTPATWMLRDHDQAVSIAERELQNGHLIISKPLFGSQGEGIRRLEKSTDLMWLTSSRGIFYFQRFVESIGDGYSDIRVFVINNRAIAAMRRRGVSWLNNVARGASCEKIHITIKMEAIAIRAVQALSMSYAGVDLIETAQDEYIVIEVNSVPAWKGLQSVTDQNIADCLVQDVIRKISHDA